MALVGKLDILLIAKTAAMEAGLKRGGTVARRFGTSLTKTNKQLLLLAAGAVAVRAVARAFTAAVRESDSFNKSLNQSLAILNDVTGAQRAQLRLAAQTASFGKTATASEAAKGLFFLESAGFGPEAAAAALPAAIDFAQAGGGMFDLSTAIDLLTDAQSALGLASKDTGTNLRNLVQVSDALVGANTLANATVEQFSRAMTNKAAAAARNLGKSMNETLAVLAAFADQGKKGEEGGTALSIVWRDLQTKAILNEEAFRKMGVAVFDSNGEMRHTADILKDLENELEGASDKIQKQTLLAAGFSDKSVAYTQSLLGMSEKVREFNDRLDEMDGKTKDVSGRMQTQFGKLKKTVADAFGFVFRNTIGETIEISAGLANRTIEGVIELNGRLMAGLVNMGRVAKLAFSEFAEGASNARQGGVPLLPELPAFTIGQGISRGFEEKGIGGLAPGVIKLANKELLDFTVSFADLLLTGDRAGGLAKLFTPLEDTPSKVRAVREEMDKLGESINRALANTTNFGEVVSFTETGLEDFTGEAEKMRVELQRISREAGLGRFDIIRDRARELRTQGVDDATIDRLMGSINNAEQRTTDARQQEDANTFFKRMEAFGDPFSRTGIRDFQASQDQDRVGRLNEFSMRFETAAEKFDSLKDEVGARLAEGLDEETARRALLSGIQERDAARDSEQPKGVAAITQGTQAAFALEQGRKTADGKRETQLDEMNGHLQDLKDNQADPVVLTTAPIGGPP